MQVEGELTALLNADVTALKLWLNTQEDNAKTAAADPEVRKLALELVAMAERGEATSSALLQTPLKAQFAETIKPHVKNSRVAVLKNHGTVSWGESVDRAFWWTEILDAYCRILMLARQIGRVDRLSVQNVDELLDLKERFGMGVDPRRLEDADMCVNTEFGRGFAAQAGSCSCKCGGHAEARVETPAERIVSLPSQSTPAELDIERVVQEITDRIMAAI